MPEKLPAALSGILHQQDGRASEGWKQRYSHDLAYRACAREDEGIEPMIDEEIFDFLIDDASVRTLKDLLLPDANVIRLYEHYPEPKVVWWNASVPLSSGGVNRDLLVQSVSYDVEMSKSVFLDALDEIERTHGGLTLVQSYNPLPPDLHPRSFRRPKTLLRTLGKCSACLFFEMPHANETAGLSVFGRQHLEFLIDNHVIDLDGKQIALT